MRIRTIAALLLMALAGGWLVLSPGWAPSDRPEPPPREISDRPLPPAPDPRGGSTSGGAPVGRDPAGDPAARTSPSVETAAGTPRSVKREETPEERERKANEAVLHQKVAPHVAVPKLIEWLRGPDRKYRRRAMELLADIGPDAAPAVPELVEALRDKDLRHQAARALSEMGRAAHEAVGPLEACLDTPDVAFRVNVARAIWAISGVTAPTVGVLSEVLDEGPTFSPQFAAVSLGSMGADGAAGVPALVERLTRDTTIMQDKTQIYFGLARIGTAAGPALRYALKDLQAEDLKLRSAAAHAVFRISGDVTSTLPILIEAIEKGDRHVSTWAAGNIGDLGPRAAPAVPALRLARDEGIPRIKGPAAMSLYRITGDPEEALPLFIAGVEGLGWFAPGYAEQLGEMGRDALLAVPVLEAATEKGSYSLRREAKQALEKIQGR